MGEIIVLKCDSCREATQKRDKSGLAGGVTFTILAVITVEEQRRTPEQSIGLKLQKSVNDTCVFPDSTAKHSVFQPRLRNTVGVPSGNGPAAFPPHFFRRDARITSASERHPHQIIGRGGEFQQFPPCLDRCLRGEVGESPRLSSSRRFSGDGDTSVHSVVSVASASNTGWMSSHVCSVHSSISSGVQKYGMMFCFPYSEMQSRSSMNTENGSLSSDSPVRYSAIGNSGMRSSIRLRLTSLRSHSD